MTDALPETTYRELLLLILRKRKRLKIVGESMLPLLKPGDEILIDPHAYRKSLPQIDDIIVTIHPLQRNLTIVKRISAIDINNCKRFFLVGDNPEASTDSRHWGTIKLADILGKVTNQF